MGRSIEGESTHTFTKNEVDTFISVIELHNPDSKILDAMILDWRNANLSMFKTILKLGNNAYGNASSAITNGTQIYTDEYISKSDLNQWYSTILNTTRTNLGLGQ